MKSTVFTQVDVCYTSSKPIVVLETASVFELTHLHKRRRKLLKS
jgi:hypothetical protein